MEKHVEVQKETRFVAESPFAKQRESQLESLATCCDMLIYITLNKEMWNLSKVPISTQAVEQTLRFPNEYQFR